MRIYICACSFPQRLSLLSFVITIVSVSQDNVSVQAVGLLINHMTDNDIPEIVSACCFEETDESIVGSPVM